MKFAGWMIFAALLAPVVPASAQEPVKFTTVNCADAKISGPGDLVCLVSNDKVGSDSLGSSPRGVFRYWVARNRGAELQVYFYAVEAIGMESAIRPPGLVDEIRTAIPMAKGATAFTASRTGSGADYTTFRSAAGESCVGIRKHGAQRTQGYAWVLLAGSCRPGPEPLGEAEVAAFAAKTGFRN